MNADSHPHAAVQASYPAPTVTEAPAGILLPGAVTTRVTIVTPTLTGLPPEAKIEIAFVFGDYRSASTPYVPGASFAFPAKELGVYLGKHVLVGYDLTIDGVTTPSERMDLHVMAFGDRDPLLPAPIIDQAHGGALDLTSFTGNPKAMCVPWKFAAVGQRAWWEIHGTLANGNPVDIVLYSDHFVTDDEVGGGLITPVDRARLEALENGSTITVTLWVTFDKSADRARATRFPTQIYTIRTKQFDEFVFDPTAHAMDAGTTYTRTASGGKTPYAYASSYTNVATVNNSGLVNAIREGVTIISVEDAATPKHTGRYTLSVLSPPNLPTPAIDKVSNNILDLATFTGDPNVTCAPWSNIAVGQRVWLEVHGTLDNGSADTIVLYTASAVVSSELPSGLRKAIPRARLEALKDRSVITVKLWVTFDKSSDRNHATYFPERSYTILTQKFDDFVFDPTAHIMDAGTTYTRTASGGKTPYAYASSNTNVATVNNSGLVNAIKEGAAIISVEDAATPKHTGRYTLSVQSPPNLPTPAIDKVSNNILDLATFTGDPNVTCAPWSNIAVGQRVWLEVHGTLDNGSSDIIVLYTASAVVSSELPNGLRKAIPRARLEALKDRSVITVKLWVTFDKSSDRNQATYFPERPYTILTQKFDDFVFDPTPHTMGAGTTYTRTASGGKTPYSYISSNTTVATVNGNGLVTASRAGSTTITASDSANPQNKGSYEMSVVDQLRISGPNSVNINQTFQFTASGGKAPYRFNSSNSSVAQITNATNGSGIGRAKGETAITVIDSESRSANARLTVTDPTPPPPKPTVSPTSYAARIGGQYKFTASGGTPPYQWEDWGFGTVTFNPPTGPATTATYVRSSVAMYELVRVKDAKGQIADAYLWPS